MILFTDIGRGAALFQVSAAGGQPTRVTSPAAGDTHLWPHFLPDGRHFLYQGSQGAVGASTHVGDLHGAEARPLLTGQSQAVYVASGHVLFVKGRALLAQPRTGQPFA